MLHTSSKTDSKKIHSTLVYFYKKHKIKSLLWAKLRAIAHLQQIHVVKP